MLRATTQTTRGRVIVLLGAIVLILLGSATLGHFAFDIGHSFGDALWSATLHVLDPSSLHGDHGAAERAIGVFQVVAGLTLLVGLLFTFVAEIVSNSLERLGQSERPVHARDHLLIVGGEDLVIVAARAAAEASRGHRLFERLVVLAPTSARESRDRLRAELAELGDVLKFDLVFGDTVGDSGFDLGAADAAAAILLTPTTSGPIAAVTADVEVMQSGLALHDYLDERGATPLVRILTRRGRNTDAAWELFPQDWDAVVGDRTIGALLRLAITAPELLRKIPAVIESGTRLMSEPGLVTAAWARVESEGRPLRLSMVGCGYNAPALMEDLAEFGAERFELTVLAPRRPFEIFLGAGPHSGIELEFIETRLDQPERLADQLAATAPDLIHVTPSPVEYDPRVADAEAMLTLLHVLRIAGAEVPVVAELFLPDGIDRLPADPRLFVLSGLRAVAAAVTLNIFDPAAAAALEKQLSAN